MFWSVAPFFSLIGGLIILALSADRLLRCATALARRFDVSPVVIGMTVIAFGTSLPEFLVSAMAALHHSAGIAAGNAVGSDIINVGLILGGAGIFYRLRVKARFLTREFPILIAVILLTWLVLSGGQLRLLQATILAVAFIGYLVYLAKTSSRDQLAEEAGPKVNMSLTRAVIESIIMLTLLVLSSRFMVWGGVAIAHQLGISDLVIGLTIVALGTSLPELAAAVASIRHGLHDVALATVVGSNIFNLLAVLALPGFIGGGIIIPAAVLRVDIPVMLGLTLLFALFGYLLWFNQRKLQPAEVIISRRYSLLVLLGFVAYLLWLILEAF